MSKKTRSLTLPALFSALTVVSLYIASVWPTGIFGLVAFASMFAAAAVIETGLSGGIYVFIVSSVLGMLIVPNKTAPLLYIVFLGYYPVVKSLIERRGPVLLQWFLKLLVFNAALTIVWLTLRSVVFAFGEDMPVAALVFLVCNVVFVIFDYGFSKVILFYMARVSKHIRGSW